MNSLLSRGDLHSPATSVPTPSNYWTIQVRFPSPTQLSCSLSSLGQVNLPWAVCYPRGTSILCLPLHHGCNYIRPETPESHRLASFSQPIFSAYWALWSKPSCPEQPAIWGGPPLSCHLSSTSIRLEKCLFLYVAQHLWLLKKIFLPPVHQRSLNLEGRSLIKTYYWYHYSKVYTVSILNLFVNSHLPQEAASLIRMEQSADLWVYHNAISIHFIAVFI